MLLTRECCCSLRHFGHGPPMSSRRFHSLQVRRAEDGVLRSRSVSVVPVRICRVADESRNAKDAGAIQPGQREILSSAHFRADIAISTAASSRRAVGNLLRDRFSQSLASRGRSTECRHARSFRHRRDVAEISSMAFGRVVTLGSTSSSRRLLLPGDRLTFIATARERCGRRPPAAQTGPRYHSARFARRRRASTSRCRVTGDGDFRLSDASRRDRHRCAGR